MKLDYLRQNKRLVPFALFGVSVVFGVLILHKITSFFVSSAEAGSLIKRAVAHSESEPGDVKEYLAKSQKIASSLKSRNLFVPRPPRQHPVKGVLGILGDEAFINGKWYKTGDKVGDAKVVAVEPTQVKIEWDGQTKYFAPIAAVGSASSSRSGGPDGRDRGGDGRPQPGMGGGPPGGGGFPRGGIGGLSEEERARMRERFAGMRERFENASPEERERMRNEMRDRFGGGRGPGGGPGGPGGGRGPSGGGRGFGSGGGRR